MNQNKFPNYFESSVYSHTELNDNGDSILIVDKFCNHTIQEQILTILENIENNSIVKNDNYKNNLGGYFLDKKGKKHYAEQLKSSNYKTNKQLNHIEIMNQARIVTETPYEPIGSASKKQKEAILSFFTNHIIFDDKGGEIE